MPQSEDAKDRLHDRDWDMWSDYVKGSTQREISEKYGISQSAVSLRLKAVREGIPEEEKIQVVRRHLDGVSALSRELWQLVDSSPAPAYSNGRRMTMPNLDDPDEPGEQVWDHSGRLAAMDRLGKFWEREAKLLGLEAPTQSEISGSIEVKRPVELLALLDAARAKQAADEAALRGEALDG